MNVTRDMVRDLLPVYLSGEASADTRALVEEYFAANPEFERTARRMADSLKTFQTAPSDEAGELEKRTLMRTRTELRGKNMSLGVTVTAVVAILALVATKSEGQAHSSTYPLAVLMVVFLAAFAALALHTRKTGL